MLSQTAHNQHSLHKISQSPCIHTTLGFSLGPWLKSPNGLGLVCHLLCVNRRTEAQSAGEKRNSEISIKYREIYFDFIVSAYLSIESWNFRLCSFHSQRNQQLHPHNNWMENKQSTCKVRCSNSISVLPPWMCVPHRRHNHHKAQAGAAHWVTQASEALMLLQLLQSSSSLLTFHASYFID